MALLWHFVSKKGLKTCNFSCNFSYIFYSSSTSISFSSSISLSLKGVWGNFL